MQLNLLEKTKTFTEKDFIIFLQEQGITVKTNTKARGNLGIYFNNRIDISTMTPESRRLSVLAHEYAHKVHYDIETTNFKTGGTLEKIFNTENISEIKSELVKITNFVDENSKLIKINAQKEELKQKIKTYENIIKKDYPEFKRSYPFKEINSYFRKTKSPAKYLLKYPNIKIKEKFLFISKDVSYSINTLDKDFEEMPESFRAYIKLKNIEKQYKKVLRYKNKAQNYYEKPTELFSRFIEGLFIDKAYIQKLAPVSYSKFYSLLNANYYGNLKKLLLNANIYNY